jgi:hypothetical protein
MTILNIDSFIQCKYLDECCNLDIDIINNILNIFNNSDNNKIKKNKKIILKKQNILKNSKIQNIKDKIINKINLILNKLSENNYNNLIIEFINNIKFTDQNEFDEFSKAIYFKIINEFKFVKRYLDFYKVIITIYSKVYNYTISHLFDIIENKFKLDYLSIPLDNDFIFLINIDGEELRLNNLYLINELINNNLITNNINEYIDNIILTQNKYYSDIYYWFKNKKLSENQENKIKELINNNSLSARDTILLENIFNNTKDNEDKIDLSNKIDKKNNIINKEIKYIKKEPFETKAIKKPHDNIFNIELDNIISEYLYLESIDEVDYFIEKSCTDAITKNNFSENIINKYFHSQIEDSNKIIYLVKDLIKRQILFKSNLSRGLLNLYNKWSNCEIYNNKTKLKSILLLLKSMGITKGLENLMSKNNIN